jgi:hypothetical protein
MTFLIRKNVLDHIRNTKPQSALLTALTEIRHAAGRRELSSGENDEPVARFGVAVGSCRQK